MAIAELLSAALEDHRAGRIGAAMARYQEVLQQEPQQADALSLLGTALLQTGQAAAAVASITRAIELSGANTAAATARHAHLFANLGSALQACGRADEALASWRRGLTLAPDLPELHSNLGNALLARGEVAPAIESYRVALSLRPDYPECLFNLGNAFAVLKRFDLAIESYRKAVELHPRYVDALNNLGNVLLEAGRATEAIETLRAAEAVDPGSLAVRVNLASALNSVGQVEAAVARYRSIVADHPDAASAHYNLGNALVAVGDREGAAECYRRALVAQPDYADAHYNLAKMCQANGDLQAAEDGFRAALAFQPRRAGTLFSLANLLVDQRRFSEAGAQLRRLIELEPTDARAHCLLGMALAGDEQLDEAVASYRRALELAPDFAEAHYNLAHALADCGRTDAAIAAFEASIALRPHYPEAHRSLGGLLQGLGRHDAAAACFAAALRLQPLIIRPAAAAPAALSVLLLVAPGRGNTPIDYFTRQAPYDSCILLFLPNFDYDVAALRTRADVVFNLISDVDLGGDLLSAASDFIDRLGKPVLNHPDRIRPTDRDSMAHTLADLGDAVVPPTRRYSRAALADSALDVEPPVLLRPAGSHGGDDMELVTASDQIAALVAASRHDAFYLTRFVDYRSADGYFRKYRLIFVGDQILPYHLAIADSWKVHYYRTEMVRHAWMREEEAAFLDDARAAFAPRHIAALEAIRRAVALDFFGIDCGLDRDGRLVVFEVNASMLVHANDPEPVFAYKQAPVARIKRAFEAMLATAAGRVSAPA
jgi:tetratricopeptide (TPR) repeat protein